MSQMRFGIIACSNVARKRFLPALLESKSAQLEHIGSRDKEKAKAFSEEFNSPKYGTYEDVLNDPDVDCVYISTPPNEHEKWSIQAAKHGKHIICEKPAAMNLEQAKNIINECTKNNVCFLEGYMYLFHPQHAEVKKIVNNNDLGKLKLISSQTTYPRPPEGDIRLNPDLAGGAFFDSAGYPVSASLMLTDEMPISVLASKSMDDKGIDSSISMILNYESGLKAQLFAGFDMQYCSKYFIIGTKGRIEVKRAFAVAPDYKPLIILEQDFDTKNIELDPANQFMLMIDKFAEAVNNPDMQKTFTKCFLRQNVVMDAALHSIKDSEVKEIRGVE